MLSARKPRAALEDRDVRRHERVADSLEERENLLLGPGTLRVRVEPLVWLVREVVEEDAADAACLATVGDEEVLVAPLLERRVDVRAVRVACVLDRLVEVDRVFFVQVRLREVRPATEPTIPCNDLARLPSRLLFLRRLLGMSNYQ